MFRENEQRGSERQNANSSGRQQIRSAYKLLLQLVLLLGLLQQHVGLREFGLQELLFQVSVFEHLFQVLENNRDDL